MEIIVGKDIREYKVKDIGPLTLRQAICVIVALVCCYGAWALCKATVGDVPVVLIMVAAVPAVVVGFVEPYGLPIEKYITTAFMENFLNPKYRLYESDFTYSEEDIKFILGEEAGEKFIQEVKEERNGKKKPEKKEVKGKMTPEQRKSMRGYE